MKLLKVNNNDWHVVKANKRRLNQAVAKMQEAITADAVEMQNRKSCLPEGWRNRLLK